MVRHMKMAGMLLAITLLSGFVAGCVIIGETSDSQTTSNSEDTDQTTGAENLAGLEPYDLTMAVPIFDTNPADMEAVEDELNKLTQEKINATVTMLPINIGVWGQQMNLMMSGGEKLDVAFSMGAGGMYQSAAATGKLCPLDELLEKYGQGIVEQVGQEYVEGARYNGKIYAVPTNRNFGQAAALFMRKDLVEKHNIDVAAIKTIDDLDNVFKIIKENEPGVVPLAAGLSSPLEFYRTFDRLGDSYGVLPGFDNGMKVENHYERPEYADLLNKVRAWYK
ncbi:extracellular solute-binding protein, partial [Paenibacillus sp.]|uniref:extracellular solute-binding protein n=1 Tax=Paenibacillus sp. TaxID=58172 RepID=UPI002D4BBDEE